MLIAIDIETDTSAAAFDPTVPSGLDPRAAAITHVCAVTSNSAGISEVVRAADEFDDGERGLLGWLVSWLNGMGSGDVVITWNGLFFDLPFIEVRCLLHGIATPFRFISDPALDIAPKYGPAPWFSIIAALHPSASAGSWNTVVVDGIDAAAPSKTVDMAPLLAPYAAEHGIKHALGPVAQYVLGIDDWKLNAAMLHTYAADEIRRYVAADARNTLALYSWASTAPPTC